MTFGKLASELERPLVARQNADLECGERAPRISVADLRQELDWPPPSYAIFFAEPAWAIPQRSPYQRLDVLDTQRLKLKDLAAAHQER